MIESVQLKRIVEAALLASSHPLSLPQLSGLFAEEEMPSHDDLARAISELTADCAERGVELREVASGFRYQVRQEVHPWVARLWTERQTRYSRAQLETLALIAYRQPITRGEIEQIRGVAVSSNIIKTLEEREWIRSVGHRDVPGKPELFGTTRAFLDYFNLKSLDELPPLAEIRDLNEFDPQLNLGPVGIAQAAGLMSADLDHASIEDRPAQPGSISALTAAAKSMSADDPSAAATELVELESVGLESVEIESIQAEIAAAETLRQEADEVEFAEEPADLGFSPLGSETEGESADAEMTSADADHNQNQAITDSHMSHAESASQRDRDRPSPDTAASAESFHHAVNSQADESGEATPDAASDRDAATPELSA
jgi:segregation and condensation protein B